MGVCLALGGALLTGCSSDITISQSDLNNLINNANNYLVDSQKQNSESIRSELNTLLVNGFNNSMYSTSFSCTMLEDFYIMGVSFIDAVTNLNNNSELEEVDAQADMDSPYSYTFKWTLDKDTWDLKQYYKAIHIDGSSDFEAYDYINEITKKHSYYYHRGDEKCIVDKSMIQADVLESYTDVYGNLISTFASDELDGVDIVKYEDGENVVYTCAFSESDGDNLIYYSLILTFKGEDIVSIERREFKGEYITNTTTYTFDYENTEINFDTTGYERVLDQES